MAVDLRDIAECVLVPDTPACRPLQQALRAVSGVHRVPSLAPIGVDLSPDVVTRGEALYVSLTDGRPARIEVSAAARFPAFSFVHEIGHYLDHQGLGAPGVWASEEDPLLDSLRRAWERSAAVRALRRAVRAGRMSFVLPGGLASDVPLARADLEDCEYYLRPQELFARSYAQYIARRSQDGVLLDQIYERREGPEGRFFRVQWPDDDFDGLARAFDRLFEGLGWLR